MTKHTQTLVEERQDLLRNKQAEFEYTVHPWDRMELRLDIQKLKILLKQLDDLQGNYL